MNRLRTLWSRIACRLRGHRQVEIVSYDRRNVTVGQGCTRYGCGEGTVESRRRQGPRPHPDTVQVRPLR